MVGRNLTARSQTPTPRIDEGAVLLAKDIEGHW